MIHGRNFRTKEIHSFNCHCIWFSGVDEDYKKVLLSYKPTLKVVKNGDSYTIYTSRPDNTIKEVTFKNGVEFDEQVEGGLSVSKF